MKCKACGHWNRIEVEKVFLEPESPEPKVKVFVPMYLPLRVETCKKCKTVIAEPKELIRISKKKRENIP
jgi:hypothetical protein